MHANLHALLAPVLIAVIVISMWRRLLVIVGAVFVAAVAIGLYQILTFVRH